MVSYSFSVDEEEDTQEPLTFHEASSSTDKLNWICAMKEFAPGECIYLLLYVNDMLNACKSNAQIEIPNVC